MCSHVVKCNQILTLCACVKPVAVSLFVGAVKMLQYSPLWSSFENRNFNLIDTLEGKSEKCTLR